MRIRVDEIPETGRLLHFHWDESRLRQLQAPDDPLPIGLDRPAQVDLEIYQHPDHIRIHGNIQALLGFSCHRCLESYSRLLDLPVEVFLVKEKKEAESSEEEVELEADDLEYEFFDGEVVDIDLLVASQIFLALPFKALCSEDCKGICPRCGANLNLEACSCPKDQEDSPFAALRAIKQSLPGKANA
jgi:uncharacterized protein